jgi:hypothetical protein
MKKLIYGNIGAIIILLILPWFYLESTTLGNRYFSSKDFIYFSIFVCLSLISINIRESVKLKGKKRLVPIAFIIPPALVLLYYILGFIAFSRYTIIG